MNRKISRKEIMSQDSDEPEQSLERIPADGEHAPLLALSANDRLYDFFKHMTTLSLVSLGGIVTIASEGIVEMRPLALR